MTFKTLTLTLTSSLLLDHIKISFCGYKPLQKYSRTFILAFFLLTLKKLKTTYVMKNLHLYVPKKRTYMTNQLY